MPLLPPPSNGNGQAVECSIIIPVYNGLDYTRSCIEALIRDQSQTTFELIVVDNGSTDGVRDYLKTRADQMTLILPDENLGFARANNLAAKSARGRALLLLNNDTIPEAGWLDSMMERLDSDHRIGIVGAKLLFPHTRLIQHAGVAFDDLIRVHHVYENFPEDHPAVNRLRDFQVVTAACMLIRTDIFRNLGGFDEGFVNGFEDVDLCLQVKEAGHRVVYEPKAVVLHFCGMSKGRHDNERENGRLLFQKWSAKVIPDISEILGADGFDFRRTGANGVVKPRGIDLPAELEEARGLLRTGRLLAALEKYKRLYNFAPHSGEIVGYLATIYERLGEWDQAGTMWLRLTLFRPDVATLQHLADNAIKRGQYDVAARVAEGIVESLQKRDTRTAEALTTRGDAAFKIGDLAKAESCYEQALDISPILVRALIGKGTIRLAKGNHAGARTIFEEAREIDRHHARAALGLAIALEGQAQYHEAADQYEEAVRLDPENMNAIRSGAELFRKLGLIHEADALLVKGLERYPDDPEALLMRAELASEAGSDELANALIENVKVFAPNHPRLAERIPATRRMRAAAYAGVG
jgi:GT2 family glycosyltransferase/tetratricopeptide (TPR) repeat protein